MLIHNLSTDVAAAWGRQIVGFGLDMDFWILKIKIQSNKKSKQNLNSCIYLFSGFGLNSKKELYNFYLQYFTVQFGRDDPNGSMRIENT